MGLVLAERNDNALQLRVGDVEILYDPYLQPFLDGITLDYRHNYWGEPEFYIYGLNDCH